MAELNEPAAPPLDVDVARDGDGNAILVLRGELDISVADRARHAVQQVVATAPPRLVYDLSALTFMDSSGLAILLESAEQVTVEVRRASDIVARLLEATGIAGVLHFEQDGR